MPEASMARMLWRSSKRRTGFGPLAALTLTMLSIMPHAAAAPYRIEAGDLLEFAVASLPNLRQRIAVDINGDVDFPLLQDIHAAGLSLTELRNKVRELISAKPFRQRGTDGREALLTIDPDEITIGMIEYRPIYIIGDVGRQGEQPFRPGITVRQAISVGGGLDAAQMKLGNPALQVADLRSDYQTLWTSLLGQRATVNRVQAELDDRTTFEDAVVNTAPVEASAQTAITRRAGEELGSRIKNYRGEKAFIATSVSQADQFLAVLKDQQSNEKQGADLDAQDFDRVNALFAKGAVPITRVIDARRSLLLSSTRQLQTTVQVSENQIRREGLLRSMDKLEDERRAQLLQDLQVASLSVLELQSKLRAVSQKLALLGKGTVQQDPEATAEIRIFRRGVPPIPANDEAELQPGDVVKVKLKDDLIMSPDVR